MGLPSHSDLRRRKVSTFKRVRSGLYFLSAAAAMWGCCTAAAWSQQGETVPLPSTENAHAFLSEILGRNNEVSASCKYEFKNCADDDTAWITSFRGSACQTEVQFRMNNGRLDSFTIDWTKVAGITPQNYGGALIIQGGTRAHWDWVSFRTGSDEMKVRVSRAMTVIKAACDKAAKFGF